MAEIISVCIEIDEDGTITVGAEPPEGDESESGADDGSDAGQSTGMTDLSQPPEGDDEDAEKSYMRPAKSFDDARSIARDLLRNASQVGGATMGGEPGGAGAQSAADAAFKSRRGSKSPMGM
jgi:hypothetical protein